MDITPNTLMSPNDKRECFTYVLPNKLRVHIIHDNKTEITGVGMHVNVGYFNDIIPGTAHFVEHLLFNGTENFPGENDFSSLISKCGGFYNAYTSHKNTCYFFSVTNDILKTALTNFAEFFICPLLKKDCIEREKEAINAEHLKNIRNDDWRENELLKITSNNKYFKKFGTGSNETLNVENIDVYVREFFNKYYSSDKMTLIITSKKSIENIKHMVDILFGKITIKNFEEPDVQNVLNIGKIIRYLPIKNDENFALVWEIPFDRNLSKSPINFLLSLINNQGVNSICRLFDNKSFILNFNCDIREIVTDQCILSLNIKLSKIGMQNIKYIVSMINEYLMLIKKNIETEEMKRLYNDYLELLLYRFKYPENYDMLDNIINLCSLIHEHDIDPKHIFITNIIVDHYTTDIKNNLKKILDKMTINNMIIIHGSKFHDDVNMKTCEHYGTKYDVIENNLYKSDGNIQDKNLLFLPEYNKFLSTSENMITITTKTPQLIQNSVCSYIYPTTKFNNPNVCIISTIKMDLNLHTHSCVLLYLAALLNEINPYIFEFKKALYHINIKFDNNALIFQIHGNYEKILFVCEYIVDKIKNRKIDEKHFIATKFNLINIEESKIYDAPHLKVETTFENITNNLYYSNKKSTIEKITKDVCVEEFKKALNNGEMLLLISGNCDEKLGKNVNNLFEHLIETKTNKNKTKIKECNLPKESKKYSHSVINKHDEEENVAVGYYVYLGNDLLKTYCFGNLIHNLINSEYFDQLRTKEMFGYIVKSELIEVGEVDKNYYYLFIVQSPNKTISMIEDRTRTFILEYKTKLEKLGEKEFEFAKKNCIEFLNKDYDNLLEMSTYIFSTNIANKYLKFDYKEMLLKEYEKITLKDLIEFYVDKFINSRTEIVIKIDKQNKNLNGGGNKVNILKNCMQCIRKF